MERSVSVLQKYPQLLNKTLICRVAIHSMLVYCGLRLLARQTDIVLLLTVTVILVCIFPLHGIINVLKAQTAGLSKGSVCDDPKIDNENSDNSNTIMA